MFAYDPKRTWERSGLGEFLRRGSHGNYLLGKVAKVFPDLARDVRISS